MKYVHIVTQMERGGAQQVALLLAEGQRKIGHQAEVWFLYKKRPAFEGVPGIRVIADEKPHSIIGLLSLAIRYLVALRRHRPDALITHTHYSNVLGQLPAVLAGCKYRLAVQHNPVQTYPRFAQWADRLVGMLGLYRHNVAVSQTVVHSCASYPASYRRRLIKVYNGIPDPHSTSDRVDTRAKWRLPQDAFLVANVGRLAPQKNHALMLEALAQLPGVHAALAGDGELRQELEELVARLGIDDRIHFLGEVTHEDVLDVLGASDALVMSSLFEAMPMAVLEALSLGLPIVASNIPALREVLGADEGEPAGLLFDLNRPNELAECISTVMLSEETRKQLRAKGKARSVGFGVDKMVSEYEHLLH